MKNTSKKNRKTISLKYIFTESTEKLNNAFDILFNEVLKNKKTEPMMPIKENKPGEFNSLYDYYKIQYPKDLETFKNTCTTDSHTKEPNNKLFFVQDLENLKKNNHYLLKKKHFMYFMTIHTAFLMTVHNYFGEKYEEFKLVNKGVIFEFGCTNCFMRPWDILTRLDITLDKKLFSRCVGLVISQTMTDYYFCGIIPRDFMDKFIDDPDLNDHRTSYGKEWKEVAKEEWFQSTRCICCPKKL